MDYHIPPWKNIIRSFHISLRFISAIPSRFTQLNRKLFSLIVFSLLYTTASFAACTATDVLVTFPDLKFNLHSIPLNGKIGSERITAAQDIFTCTGDLERYIWDPGGGGYTINGLTIYPTSAAGIGYAVALEPTNFCSNTIQWVPFTTCKLKIPPNLNARLHFQLYKTGPISNAKNISIFKNSFTLNEAFTDGSANNYKSYMSANPFNLTLYTCSLQSSSITNINLPKITSNALPGINSRAGSTPFSLTISCPSNISLNITFTDNNKIGQTTNILTPAATSTAKGVGIQLQYNGNIISFGPDSADPGTTNQILLNSNLIGTQTFPFVASYIRTGTVTPGSLTSTATFTLSYQ
ncbi:fimbrial protein [Aquitalea denitrificans]|uniref:fimbrial protein n=1 Tax=Aquitalea denitrificans TaxID=519081 RepID=UPI0013596E9D|nr:fimbrial protein [Aquitalea denitrificans]